MPVVRAAAFLFDMDGVLVDSTVAVFRHWTVFATWHGIDAESLLVDVHGRRAVDVIDRWRGSLRTPYDEAVSRFEALDVADQEGLRVLPGARETLSMLPEGSWAVVTSASRAVARARLQAAGLPEPGTMVSADDVPRGKPDPAPYLAGARALGVAPERCVVVEDAPSGVAAGLAAGCRVLALLTTHAAEELAGVDLRVTDLAAVRLEAARRGDRPGLRRVERGSPPETCV